MLCYFRGHTAKTINNRVIQLQNGSAGKTLSHFVHSLAYRMVCATSGFVNIKPESARRRHQRSNHLCIDVLKQRRKDREARKIARLRKLPAIPFVNGDDITDNFISFDDGVCDISCDSHHKNLLDTAQGDSVDNLNSVQCLDIYTTVSTTMETPVNSAVEGDGGDDYRAHLLAIQHVRCFGYAVPPTIPNSCSSKKFLPLQIKQGWSINNRYVGRSIRKIFEYTLVNEIFKYLSILYSYTRTVRIHGYAH